MYMLGNVGRSSIRFGLSTAFGFVVSVVSIWSVVV